MANYERISCKPVEKFVLIISIGLTILLLTSVSSRLMSYGIVNYAFANSYNDYLRLKQAEQEHLQAHKQTFVDLSQPTVRGITQEEYEESVTSFEEMERNAELFPETLKNMEESFWAAANVYACVSAGCSAEEA